MRRLVTIQLKEANVALFEKYEAIVLPLVEKHGGRLEARVRSDDGQTETHLLFYPDERSYQAFLSDPIRQNARHIWDQSGATAASLSVVRVE